MALDLQSGHVYFSDKAGKNILRAGLEMPRGQTAAERTDVEELVVLPGLAMPVDLTIDEENRTLYWGDRLAGTITRAGLDVPAGETPATRTDLETELGRLDEPIGLSLDVPNDRLYSGELGYGVSEASLDGEDPRRVCRATGVTGVTLVHLPVQ